MDGFHLGNVVGLVLTPLVMSSIGLSGPFILFSSLGLLWLTIWAYHVTNEPQESSSIRKTKLRLIQDGKYDSPPLQGKTSSYTPSFIQNAYMDHHICEYYQQLGRFVFVLLRR